MNGTIKWTIAGVICLAVIIGGYYGITGMTGDSTSPHNGHEMPMEEGGGHGDHHGDKAGEKSEVASDISLTDDGQLLLTLTDDQGKPLDESELSMNHERLVHLIVVSQDLQQFYHLHPEPGEKGEFKVDSPLKPGSYQAFVDIQPKNHTYAIAPLSLQVGEEKTSTANLKPDSDFTQTIQGTTVTMTPTTFQSGQSVTLDFSLEGGEPEPYLGALGHVVILDEQAKDFVHVHPTSETDTRFATTFNQPGMYKIWAEFKIDGQVKPYSFTVEVK